MLYLREKRFRGSPAGKGHYRGALEPRHRPQDTSVSGVVGRIIDVIVVVVAEG